MLQNFDDLERASSSTIALWLALGRDLVTSVGSYWIRAVLGSAERSFARQTPIVVGVLSLIVAIARHGHGEHEPIIWTFCGGYAIGWVGGWLRRRTVIAFTLLGIALSVSADQRFFLAVCYGCTLGWIAGWVGKRRSGIARVG
jgi:hypothetical protein